MRLEVRGGRIARLPRWARELVRLAALMVGVSLLTFALVSASPIDPVRANVGQAAYGRMGEAKREQLARYWGSDQPFLERYAHWAKGALHGDLGMSLRFNKPVAEVVAQRAGNTLMLMAFAWVVSGVLGVSLGVIAATCRGRWPDRIVRGYCFVLSATPSFWIGLVALMVFSVALGWFPFGFSVPIGVDAASVSLGQRIHHMVLPAATLSVVGVANVALHTREKAIDVLESDYARLARLRGESAWEVVLHHGLRNLMGPAIALQFSQVSELLGGSVLVEQVFSYPGLGQAAVTAGVGGDAPLLVAIALATALVVFAGNLVGRMLQSVLDPRIHGKRCDRARISRTA